MPKILLVEDDPILARGTQVNLELEGFQIIPARSVSEAVQQEMHQKLDLVLLDLGLPDQHGFEFLKKIRQKNSRLPIIILTAQTDEDSVVQGLQLGAQDYIRKPFGQRELLARIKSTLRQAQDVDHQIRFDDLLLLIEQRVVKYQEITIELNRREFDILFYLTKNAEKIVSRESLLSCIDKEGELFDRTIDSHVSHLRNRLKKNGVIAIKINSVYGIGYRLEKVES